MKVKKNIKTFFLATMRFALCFVFIFNTFSSAIHLLDEHQIKTETCTSEDEKDACHRYIVHQEESSSCNGSHQHITPKDHDCFVCKYLKDRKNQAFHENQIHLYFFVQNAEQENSESKLFSQRVFHSYLRGPPCVS